MTTKHTILVLQMIYAARLLLAVYCSRSSGRISEYLESARNKRISHRRMSVAWKCLEKNGLEPMVQWKLIQREKLNWRERAF